MTISGEKDSINLVFITSGIIVHCSIVVHKFAKDKMIGCELGYTAQRLTLPSVNTACLVGRTVPVSRSYGDSAETADATQGESTRQI